VPYFVVNRDRGPSWDWSRDLREQDAWDEHAEFMDRLVDEGFIVLGGPLGEQGHPLMIVRADDEDAIRACLAQDPWTPMQMLTEPRIQRWQILLNSVGDLS
jgi:uncharacterized protein YciI